MARIRSIKPEFWSSEQITECSVNARLMFIGMWNFSDDSGRKVASTKRLKMEVFPGDKCNCTDVRQWMDELIAHGLVMEYESQGQRYWQVTGWKHQKISHPQPSAIPDPFSEGSVNVPGPFTPDLIGIELNGIELKGIHTSTPKRVVVYSKEFEEWWKHYPRKVQKGAAAKAHQAACRKADADVILQATIAFSLSPKAAGDYCPYPTTWLNQNRWEDNPKEWQRAGNNSKPKSDQEEFDEAMAKWKAGRPQEEGVEF